MWARKRIDISWGDLLRGAGYVLLSGSREAAERAAEEGLGSDDGVIACLTERSGFDLLLHALELPAGSEVLISAITIEDMARVLREHDLVPVPVDIRREDMALDVDALEAARTPSTKAVLVAHLYGGRSDLQAIVDWARAHDLQVWEDCAQAYEGDRYLGHPAADVALFSFGPIKTATALGGGLLIVRDPQVRAEMQRQQAVYGQQSRWEFLSRVARYAVMKGISSRVVFGCLVRICRLLGRDYDRVINGAVRNIPGDDLFKALRQQPSPPLLRLMARRLQTFSTRRLDRRAQKGQLLANLVQTRFCCPGGKASDHSYWVFPICIADGPSAVARLRQAGFDATTGSALRAIDPPADRSDLTPQTAHEIVESTLFVPVYPEMPDSEVRRLGQVVVDLAD